MYKVFVVLVKSLSLIGPLVPPYDIYGATDLRLF